MLDGFHYGLGEPYPDICLDHGRFDMFMTIDIELRIF